MNHSNSETTVAPKTRRELWAEAIGSARDAVLNVPTGESIDNAAYIRMQLAIELENAEGRALRAAQRLAELVAHLIRNLEEDGAEALTGGNGFESQTRKVADLLQGLSVRREAFQMASAVINCRGK